MACWASVAASVADLPAPKPVVKKTKRLFSNYDIKKLKEQVNEFVCVDENELNLSEDDIVLEGETQNEDIFAKDDISEATETTENLMTENLMTENSMTENSMTETTEQSTNRRNRQRYVVEENGFTRVVGGGRNYQKNDKKKKKDTFPNLYEIKANINLNELVKESD